MAVVAECDPFATSPQYYIPDSDIHGFSISSIIKQSGFNGVNTIGVHQYLNKNPDGIRTCFKNIVKLLPNHSLQLEFNKLTTREKKHDSLYADTLQSLLINALKKTTARYSRCALALSGGLDSALILALLKEASISNIEVYTLATGMTDYCELELTKRTAKYFGVRLNVVWAKEVDFISALPDAIKSSEVPLFNLHPVSKLLLARSMVADGIDCIITVDAADQVFSGTDSRNYLPIVGAIIRNEEVAYFSPFFDPKVVRYGLSHMDTNKSALRNICKLIAPGFTQIGQKKARYAPPLDISQYWDSESINWISKQTNIPIDKSSYALQSLWTTLGMLVNNMRGSL